MTGPLENRDRHLDGDEIDALVSPPRASVGDSVQALGREHEGPDRALADARLHLESCVDCQRKVAMHEAADRALMKAIARRAEIGLAQGPACHEEAEWLRVAAGLLPDSEAWELMKHAAQCGYCGPLLKEAAATLAHEATPEEEAAVAGLDTASPEWQSGMAGKLREARGPSPSTVENPNRARSVAAPGDPTAPADPKEARGSWFATLFFSPRPAFASACLVLVVAAAWFGVRAIRPPSADELLARAYTQRRTLEVRIAGAKHAPLRVERGGGANGASNLDRPAPLLQAEALIGENLRKNPDDPVWLQARARADLLDGNYESAIKALQHALESQPDSPALLTDLASAYYERGESANRPIDYGNAIEALGKALAKQPDDPIALFNRALVCEKMFLYSQAVEDWQHYLRVDPQGEWAEEARKRLSDVQDKVKKHEQGLAEPLLTPEQVAEANSDDAASQEKKAVRVKIDERVEDYLTIALTDWLREAFSTSGPNPQASQTRAALAALASVLRDKHGDTWLADVLLGGDEPDFSAGVATLAAAVTASRSGDYSATREAARKAGTLFHGAHNRAGELRANEEEVYADHLLYQGAWCQSAVEPLSVALANRRYAWLRAQTDLESAMCAGIAGNIGVADGQIVKGTNEAKLHDYRALFMRGLGFESGKAASMGDESTGFSLATQGLEVFWAGPVDLMKGYNLYTDLDTAADHLRLPYLQVVLWRQATDVIDGHPDILMRAMAHRWYGSSAYLANMPTLAEAEFVTASRLFAAAPQTAATARDHLDAESWLARIEARQGDLDRASARLAEIRPLLGVAPSFGTEINFYTTAAEIGSRRSDDSATDSALRSAVFLAEWGLRSFPAERSRRQWSEQTDDTYRTLVLWKFCQGDPAAALELWEWYKGAGMRAASQADGHLQRANFNSPPDAALAPPIEIPNVVAQRLPALLAQTVVAYAIFREGTVVWAYDERGIVSHWMTKPSGELEGLVSQFQRLCATRDSSPAVLRAAGRNLYDLLVGPIEDRIAGRSLVLELDGVLSTIPFDALVDRQGRYLLQSANIVISPGLYRAAKLRERQAITAATPALVVSVAAPASDGGDEIVTPLPDAEDEARNIAGGFQNARWLNGSEATLAAIRREIQTATVFHFSGHALAAPARSGLLLAERDQRSNRAAVVEASSFEASQLSHLQLAILAACDTGTETAKDFSGTEGLAQAFLRAGVPNVIASRWEVDSAGTNFVMTQLYANLLAGSDASSSLRAAQLQLAARPGFSQPYYWAGFGVQGL